MLNSDLPRAPAEGPSVAAGAERIIRYPPEATERLKPAHHLAEQARRSRSPGCLRSGGFGGFCRLFGRLRLSIWSGVRRAIGPQLFKMVREKQERLLQQHSVPIEIN